jgi:phosphate:Na+ symporter
MSLQWSSLFGGLGLFLWGMHMLSQGLRLAAGGRLETVLARATGTRFRGLLSGAVTTAVVQSSSAVTVATIGFVNASLLTLGSAIWVLFGANLGTTATGWIVAFAGLKIDFSLLALPLIAAGAAMKLAGDKHRLSAWGEALAGFGMLFYGIVMMQSGFADVSANWQIPQLDGTAGIALQALAGVAMTVVMQSSSASIAIALTAAQSGLIDITGAAAVVIGANIGTTVTAVLASIGATANAKRVAGAHVLFNLLTAIAAFVVLPWLVPAIVGALVWMGAGQAPATTLAIFNTVFNTLGIVLIWPLAGYMIAWLQSRFKSDVSAGAVPQYLDKTTLLVPNLAIRALASELGRILALARESLRLTLPQGSGGEVGRGAAGGGGDVGVGAEVGSEVGSEVATASDLARKDKRKAAPIRNDLKRLLTASEDFVDQMNRAEMDEVTGERLASLLRVRRYLDNVVDGEREVMLMPDALATLSGENHPDLYNAYQHYVHACQSLLGDGRDAEIPTDSADTARTIENTDQTTEQNASESTSECTYEHAYQALKRALLKAGAAGGYRLDYMEDALQRASAQRRAVQQLLKADHWLRAAEDSLPESQS